MEAAKPRTITYRMRLVNVAQRRMELRLWRYGFIVLKGKGKCTAYVGKVGDDGEVKLLFKLVFSCKDVQQDRLASQLSEYGDEFLAANSVQISEALLNYVKSWEALLRKKEMENLLSKPEELVLDQGGIDIESVKDVEFEKVLSTIASSLHPKMSTLLEIVMSVGLTLKQVDRVKGVVDNRPVWLAIVADPSTYKTTTLKLLSESKYVIFAQNFTPASLLPAKTEVTPLIELMHGRVFIIPTLSEETADKEMARKVFAALESVYDGEYAKSTGLSGFMKRFVDTVIVAAVTPAVWEGVLPYIVNIGSRWLVYRYTLSEADALEIQHRLETLSSVPVLRALVSKHFDTLLDNVNYSQLKEVLIPENYERDLEDMAKLVSRLRVVWRVETYWKEDEETGRKTAVKEVEVVQVEAPSRAFQQLKNFVRANTLLRKSSVEKIVGLPVVDLHAMKLAAELAISSTTNKLKDILLYLAEKQVRGEEVSYTSVCTATGLSRGTVENLVKVLKHPRVDLVNEDLKVEEPFFTLIKKYLLTQGA